MAQHHRLPGVRRANGGGSIMNEPTNEQIEVFKAVKGGKD